MYGTPVDATLKWRAAGCGEERAVSFGEDCDGASLVVGDEATAMLEVARAASERFEATTPVA